MLSAARESRSRMTPSCQALEGYSGGFRATGEAMAHPGEWVTVYQIRPLELVAYLLGIPFRPHHPVQALIYDPVDRCYWCLRATLVPGLCDGVVRGITPMRRFFDRCPTLDAWFYRGSDFAERSFVAMGKLIVSAADRVAGAVLPARQS